MLVFGAGIHDVGLSWIGNVSVPRVARHFSNHGADDHDMGPGLHPMLMRFLLIRVVVSGPRIPGQHVDEADLAWRIGLCTNGLEPRYTRLVTAERRTVPGNEAGEAICASLDRPFFAVLRH